MRSRRVRRIQDSVHGLMEFRGMETLAVEVLRTREVQRLRRVRQLGLVHLVFPGGEHSRLVHSLGAAHLAVRFGRQLREAGRDAFTSFLLPDEAAIRDFALAALFHDLGHGPLSHAWEDVIIGRGYNVAKWRESLGLPTDDPLLERPLKWHVLVGQAFLSWTDGDLYKALESYEGGMAKRIRAFLLGEYHLPYLPRLLDSDVDVDRADFLQRDSQLCGVMYGGYDLARLISTCTLGEADEGRLVVGFEASKAFRVVEHFLVARRAMYEAVYHHRTVRAAEGMTALFLRRLRKVVLAGDLNGFGADRIIGPLMKMVAGEAVGLRELLSADDFALQVLIDAVAHTTGADRTVVDLANRILSRSLFKLVPHPPQRVSAFLKSPRAYEHIYEALESRGFAEAEYYLIHDTPRFTMLARRKQEWGYLIDAKGQASPIREHEGFRSISIQDYEVDRLFVPEEALEAVARVLE